MGTGEGRRVGEGQFPSGASRVALVTADIARACASIRVHVYPLDARVRVRARVKRYIHRSCVLMAQHTAARAFDSRAL